MDEADVLVVGAGILGLASAYHILEENPGKKVLLVDRYGAPGQGNTGRSNAMFRNTFSSTDNQILADSAIDYYLHVQKDLKEDLGLQQIGYLWLMDQEQLAASEAYLKKMEANGIESRTLGRAEIQQKLPGIAMDGNGTGQASLMGLPEIAGGVFGPKCGRLDPDKLVRHYAKMFTEKGGTVSFNTEAEGLVVGPTNRLGMDGEPFVWQKSRVESVKLKGRVNGEVRAGTVVIACGAWENELLSPIGVDGHVKAKKRQLFSIQAQGDPKVEGLLRVDGFSPLHLLPLVILPKSGVHFKPVSEEGSLWVACEDEVNRPFIDLPDHDLNSYTAETKYYETGIRPILAGYFPAFSEARVKAMWAGLYSYNTIDYLPFVFAKDNLIVVGGDSGSGIMKGDSLGRVVSAAYAGEDEATLYGGTSYKVSKLGFERRDVEREDWVI